MAWAISSSSASMTGAAAAMAEPPQMQEPTPIRAAVLPGIFRSLYISIATTRDVVIVEMITGREVIPTFPIVPRFRPKPRRITAYCKIFLEVKAMPPLTEDLSLMAIASTIPAMIAITGAPITSRAPTCLTSSQEGNATRKHSKIPFPFFFRKSMIHLICFFLPDYIGPE